MLNPDEYSMKTIRELKHGEFFRLKPDSKKTYVRGDYDRSEKKYSCIDYDDFNHERFFCGNQIVLVDFTF